MLVVMMVMFLWEWHIPIGNGTYPNGANTNGRTVGTEWMTLLGGGK